MTKRVQDLFDAREGSDREAAYQAYDELTALTEQPVDWAYEVWDQMVRDLSHKDGAKRSFAAQMLERLAISDPDGRIFDDLPKIAAAMRDPKTVTARHTLQSFWRIALAGERQKELVLQALETRFRECEGEKNATLVRTDVMTALGNLKAATNDEAVESRAKALMESEPDEKARKKQAACWRKAAG